MNSHTAIGIDIGGTGIKAAVVDLSTGELVSERLKLATPAGGEPDAIVETTLRLVDMLPDVPEHTPMGVCFPAVVRHGVTMSAANVSKRWIGLEAEQLFESSLGIDITFVNDADAAGYAEAQFGAARGREGHILLTTLGTGIGTAQIYNGVLIPNAELGHLEIDGYDAESRAAYSAKARENLTWAEWTKRLQKYYNTLEMLLSPDLFIVGGGVSKNHREFLPLLDLKTEIVPAKFKNNAGIIGAAALAVEYHGASVG